MHRTGDGFRQGRHRYLWFLVSSGILLIPFINGCGMVGGAPLGTEVLLRHPETGQLVSCTARSECDRRYRGSGWTCLAELHRPVENPLTFTVRRCIE